MSFIGSIQELTRGVLSPQSIRFAVQVGHEQIEASLVVRVAEGNAHPSEGLAHGGHGDAPGYGLIGEGAIVLVDPEAIVVAIVGDKRYRANHPH